MKKSKRMMRKFLLILSSALLLVSLTVGATVAYLTSTDSVTNTFTVGKVAITMDEAKVNVYGEKVDENGDVNENSTVRVKKNEYKLLPGHTYVKDPTIKVTKGSEQAYIRMQVTVNDISKLKAAFPADEYYPNGYFLLEKLVNWDKTTSKWECKSITPSETDSSVVYEFWYNTVVDARNAEQTVPALFTTITIPGSVNNSELLNLNEVEITAVAHAIQADGFADAAAAWKAWSN